ncbi:PIG-U-domain-containing protein [Fistulina hepatica ATCC 64428]|uniref:PIG-U-domain-containing protein n=1 Tax=Fistulina hepatica ATCC 64428 TaxID=1128425 RepID=A0A0D7ABJ9_9AGAR|nr:PIG-U-domain-containing protein [Fistulina hepatica ATCC 64428]
MLSSPVFSLRYELVFPALVVSRLLLGLTGVSNALKHDQQLSSPLTSYSHLQEGIYLFNHDVDPYSGGVFHHSPLLLMLFTTILPTSRLVSEVLWAASDAVSAWCLVQVWRVRQRVDSSQHDSLVCASYLLNPYILLPSLALSTSTIDNMFVLLSLMYACRGKKSASLLSSAILLQLSLPSVILVAPLLMLIATDPVSRLASPRSFGGNLRTLSALLAEFVVYTVALTAISSIAAGDFGWVPQTWGVSFTLPDLTPNPGLWWYFFTEMFDHFRPFFLMVFSVHLLIYVVPICLKFQYDALYASFLLVGVLGTFKAYPTIADPGLFLSMTALFPEVYSHLRYPIVTALLHLHASLLMPLFYHLWLYQGTGNANFFYASTLVFACANGAALMDCIWAGLRIAIGKEEDRYVVAQE